MSLKKKIKETNTKRNFRKQNKKEVRWGRCSRREKETEVLIVK
jgi:hypothetical protein